MILRNIFMLWLACFALPVLALDPSQIGQNVVSDWEAWMKKYKIGEGALVVAFEGNVVATGEVGRSVSTPAKVASLSKAITAVCALKALEGAGLDYRATVAKVLPDALAQHAPRDARFGEITMGQLMTHASGITSRYHAEQLEKLRSFGKENKLWQFSKLVKEGLKAPPGSAGYHYSNANYLTLGLAVEALTGEGYEPYCQREVLTPLGITTAKLNDTWRVMSSWGGWEISARDYLTFANHYFAGENTPARPAGFAAPSSRLTKGASYGAGILFRRTGAGNNIWHLGSWRWKGRITDRFGAYFALYDNGFSVSTNYAHDAWKNEINGALDALLWKATHP